MNKQKPMKYEECHKLIDGVDHKLCNRCWEWCPFTKEYFYKNKKNNMDGHYPYCRKCAIKKSHKRMYDNMELHLEACKKHYYTSPIYKDNKIILSKERSENGKYREWQRNNPEKAKMYGEQHRDHDITTHQWIACKEYFKDESGEYCCAYCGFLQKNHFAKRLDKVYAQDLHREHVKHDGENDISNCIPSCQSCNSSKRQHDMETWFRKKSYFTEDRLTRIVNWLDNDHKKYILN